MIRYDKDSLVKDLYLSIWGVGRGGGFTWKVFLGSKGKDSWRGFWYWMIVLFINLNLGSNGLVKIVFFE